MSYELKEAALDYARRGWGVFPIYWPVPGKGCSCGKPTCVGKEIGKHPIPANGHKEATTDEAELGAAWGTVPNANIGIACETSRLVVIDEDKADAIEALLQKVPEAERSAVRQAFGSTLRAATGRTDSKGTHFYFQAPQGVGISTGVALVKGVDVRARGGYIIAPPSMHRSGAQYRWINEGAEPLPLPPALIPILLGQCKMTAKPEAELRDSIPTGARNNSAFKIACTLVRQGLNEETIFGQLVAMREQGTFQNSDADPFTDTEIRTIVNSALKKVAQSAGAKVDTAAPGEPPKAKPRLTKNDRLSTPPPDAGGIDGAALLDDIVTYIERFVVFQGGRDAAVVIALWVIHTYAIDAAEFTPYLNVKSADKRCGKSLTMDVVETLVACPLKTANVSGAAVYRVIEDEIPTLLFDETDSIFGAKKTEQSEALRGILNAGVQRGSPVIRCVGKNLTPIRFNVFCPKMLAGIGNLPDTLKDRSIPIVLERMKPSDRRVEKFRARRVAGEASALRHRIAAWASYHLERLREARVEDIPGVESPRAQDVAEPLLAIADAAGGHWPTTARAALRALFNSQAAEDDSLGVSLLQAIYKAFADTGAEGLSTDDLIRRLSHDENAPQLDRDAGGDRLASARRLARLLKPYGVTPTTARFDGKQGKGYKRHQFEDAWERYGVLSVPPLENRTIRTTVITPQNQGFSGKASKPWYGGTDGTVKMGGTNPEAPGALSGEPEPAPAAERQPRFHPRASKPGVTLPDQKRLSPMQAGTVKEIIRGRDRPEVRAGHRLVSAAELIAAQLRPAA